MTSAFLMNPISLIELDAYELMLITVIGVCQSLEGLICTITISYLKQLSIQRQSAIII